MNTTLKSTDLIEQKVATIMEYVDNYQKQTIVFEFKPEDLTSSTVIESALYFVRSKLKRVIRQRKVCRKDISNKFRDALLEEEWQKKVAVIKNEKQVKRGVQKILTDLVK